MRVEIDGVTYAPLSEAKTVTVDGETYVAVDESTKYVIDNDGDRWKQSRSDGLYTCDTVSMSPLSLEDINIRYGIRTS